MISSALLIVFAATLLALCQSAIPSFRQQSVATERSKLTDKDFLINPGTGIVATTPNFTFSIAGFDTFPILAFPDVQSFILHASVNFDKAVFRHYHPRATETLYVIKGTFSVQIIFEGIGDNRVVDIKVPRGRSTVFPEGLAHATTCKSTSGCVFVSIFNFVDPGFIPF